MVASTLRDSAAFCVGIDAGDEIVAIDGTRIEGSLLDGALRGRAPGDVVDVTIARDGRLLTKRPTLDAPRQDRVRIAADPRASQGARDAFAHWLGEPHAASAGEANGRP